MKWRIPLADLDFGLQESAAVQEVLQRKWLTMGQETKAFEKEFAAMVGCYHAFAVANCTAALHLAGMALGWSPGDEVIVPSLTFVATANAVRYTGATPVFADIYGETDFSLDPEAVASLITARTRSIIVVHYAGYAVDLPRIMALAKEHNLSVVEDAAHTPGATLAGHQLGTWGDIGCYSFFSNKNMATGEGGMVVTNDDEVAEKIQLQRSHGMTSLTWDRHQGHAFSYDVATLGYNYRIDEMRAALGRVQLRKLPRNNVRRRDMDNAYRVALATIPEITVPYVEYRGTPACHIRPVLLPPDADRRRFMAAMKARGIQTSIHYPPVHQFSAYRRLQGNKPLSLPRTEAVAAREVTLPLYPTMTLAQVETVCNAVKQILTEVR